MDRAASGLPLYADMPDLFALSVTREIVRSVGIEPPSEADLSTYAAAMRRAVRTSVTIQTRKSNPALRAWNKQVAEHAATLRALLMERRVAGWSACLEIDVLSARAREIDETIEALPAGLDLLSRAATAAMELKDSGGRPSDSAMRKYLFAELAGIFEQMTGREIQVRISGVMRDPDAAAIQWGRAVLLHAADCFDKAADDIFGSRAQAPRLREIAALSSSTLGDLFEGGRATRRSRLPWKPIIEVE